MAEQQMLGVRKWLNDQGYNNNDIGYSGNNVTLQGHNLINATPQASDNPSQGLYGGSTYATGSALQNALSGYQNTYGKPTVNTMDAGSRNTALNNTYNNVNNAVNTTTPFQFKQQQQPFSFDANSDIQYQNALKNALSNAQTASNNAQAQLGARGIGNSSIASNMANQIQQKAVGDVTSSVLPALISQAYQRYQDQNNNDYRNQVANYGVGQDQIRNQSAFANDLNNVGQQQFTNNLATNQDTRAQAAQDANFTGYYDSPEVQSVKRAMAANSAAYANASPDQQAQLHNDNLKLAASIGGRDLTGNGDYSFGQGNRTLAGQNQDFNQTQQGIENVRADKQLNATLANMTSDNARAAATEARVAGNEPIARLFDIWDRTGVAPAGIPGVPQGTKLQAKPSTTTPLQKTDYKANPDFADSIKFIDDNPDTATDELAKNSTALIAKYGYDGYQELRKYAGL